MVGHNKANWDYIGGIEMDSRLDIRFDDNQCDCQKDGKHIHMFPHPRFEGELGHLKHVLDDDIYEMKRNIAFRNLFLLETDTVSSEFKYVLGNIFSIAKWTVYSWLVGRLIAFLEWNG